ncbi:MAG: ATP-binding cassette domain-containing protein, partial [Candidatus Wallbacteria bacterium]|nr:ATP-binding cassette domain-containing protein [Candidatus Wallbacteria bacterium]
MAIVTADHLSRHYIQGQVTVRALTGVSLSIERGEFTVIAGPSGSGKTTLLNLIGCMDNPTSGCLTVDGLNISTLTGNDAALFRREKIGFIFQHFYLIPVLTAYENVEFSLDLLPGLTK